MAVIASPIWRASAAAARRFDDDADGEIEVERRPIELNLAGEVPGDIEQVGDEPGLLAGVLLDDLERVVRPLRRQRAVAEQGDPPENRVERRPQLVRHEPQELVLEAVRFFRAGARRLERGLDALALLDFQPRRDDARFQLAAILAHPIQNDGDADDEAGEEGQAHGFFPRHRQIARPSG